MDNLNIEKDFDINNYEEFYEHHYFQPLTDKSALNADRNIPRVSWAVDIADINKPKSVLDLGCLDGFTGLTIANKIKTVNKLVGVDLSKEGIEYANSRKKLIDVDSNFINDSIENYLYNSNDKFDMIILFEVIEHVKDPELLIELIDKVKTKHGLVLISTPDFEAPTFGKDDEQNKCHIRLYTLADKDYEAYNKYGTLRKATSLSNLIGKKRILSIGTYSELINCLYT